MNFDSFEFLNKKEIELKLIKLEKKLKISKHKREYTYKDHKDLI